MLLMSPARLFTKSLVALAVLGLLSTATGFEYIDNLLKGHELTPCQTDRVRRTKELLAKLPTDDFVAPWPETQGHDDGLALMIHLYSPSTSVHYQAGAIVGNETRTRDDELADTLQANLLHPHVKRIVLAYESPENKVLIDKWCIVDPQHKAQLERVHYYTYTVGFKLTNSWKGPVLMFNLDDILGHGFEDLRFLQRNKKNFITLARHTVPKLCDERNECLDPKDGALDAFLFYPPLDESLVVVANIRPDFWGSELHLLYLTEQVGYQNINYCPTMKFYHNHCTAWRARPQSVDLTKFGYRQIKPQTRGPETYA